MPSLQDPGDMSLANLDKLHHAIKAAEKHVAEERKELPQKGLPGWVPTTGKAAGENLKKMDKAIWNASLLLRDLNHKKGSLSKHDMDEIKKHTSAMNDLLKQKLQ